MFSFKFDEKATHELMMEEALQNIELLEQVKGDVGIRFVNGSDGGFGIFISRPTSVYVLDRVARYLGQDKNKLIKEAVDQAELDMTTKQQRNNIRLITTSETTEEEEKFEVAVNEAIYIAIFDYFVDAVQEHISSLENIGEEGEE
jgi:hypothetical protein